jgi:hypothetical protein
LQAAQDARDIAEAESIRSRPGPLVPQDVIEAMMDADDEAHNAMAAALDQKTREDLPPDSVRAMWEAVSARSAVPDGFSGMKVSLGQSGVALRRFHNGDRSPGR